MNPGFTNVTVMNKALCKEYLKLFWRKQGGMMRNVMFIIAAAALLIGGYQMIVGGMAAFGSLLGMLVIAGLSLWLAIYGYVLRQKDFIKRMQNNWGGESLRKDLTFHDDCIEEQTERGAHRKFYYQGVEKILANDKIIVLRMRQNKGSLLIECAGFPGGAEDAHKALEFLERACPVKQ